MKNSNSCCQSQFNIRLINGCFFSNIIFFNPYFSFISCPAKKPRLTGAVGQGTKESGPKRMLPPALPETNTTGKRVGLSTETQALLHGAVCFRHSRQHKSARFGGPAPLTHYPEHDLSFLPNQRSK